MNDKVVPLLKPRSDLGIRTLSSVAMMSVAIIAIWLGGYAFDATGSYAIVWYVGIILGLASAAIHLPIRDRPRSTQSDAVRQQEVLTVFIKGP